MLTKSLDVFLFLCMLSGTCSQVCKWMTGMAGHSRNKDFVGKAESPDACALLCVTVRTKKQEKIFANYDFDTKECHCLTQVVGVVRKAKTTVCELIDASEGSTTTGGNVPWIGDALVTNLRFTNMILINHVRKRLQVRSSLECFMFCLECFHEKDCTCLSINISHNQVDNKYICELNNATYEQYPSDLIGRSDYQYYAIEKAYRFSK